MGMFRDELQFGNQVELRAQLLLYMQPYIHQNPTLGYVLLVPPMLLTIALAN